VNASEIQPKNPRPSEHWDGAIYGLPDQLECWLRFAGVVMLTAWMSLRISSTRSQKSRDAPFDRLEVHPAVSTQRDDRVREFDLRHARISA
jgi:hypothetical protein